MGCAVPTAALVLAGGCAVRGTLTCSGGSFLPEKEGAAGGDRYGLRRASTSPGGISETSELVPVGDADAGAVNVGMAPLGNSWNSLPEPMSLISRLPGGSWAARSRVAELGQRVPDTLKG